MATTDLTRNMFSLSAQDDAREWAQIEGGTYATFSAEAELQRGVNLDLGLEALAELDASLRRFLAGSLEADAHGTLRVRGQIQTPLNLFKESGAIVRLQATAELAAGASLTLGLSVGDFLDLVKLDPAMQGLPYRLLEVFLEEVTIGAGVYGKAALSAMAYANLALTGTLVASPPNKPGFSFVAEAGVGLKAGAGYRVYARIGIDDVRRLISRSIDILVDEAFAGIGSQLPDGADTARQALDAARAPAKMALRTAYELGELISTRSIPANQQGKSLVSQRCVQIFLEETQRFLLDRLLAVGLSELERGIRLLGLSDDEWDSVRDIRERLGNRLVAAPADPFAWTPEAMEFWELVVDDAVALIAMVGPWAQSLQQSTSMVWAAAELMFAAARRMVDADEASSAIDLAPSVLHAAFTGPVNATPPDFVRDYLNAEIGLPMSHKLQREDLVVFLTEDLVLNLLLAEAPEVDRYLEIFESLVGDRRAFFRAALATFGAIDFGNGGQIDPAQTLLKLAGPLKSFVQNALKQEVLPVARAAVQGHGDLMLYLDEVILPAMEMALDVAFDRATRWDSGSINRDAFTEALSNVIMTMLGRSLVVTADVLVTTARAEMHDLFIDLADRADDPGGLADTLVQIAPAFDPADVIESVQETLRIGSTVFTPLPAQSRAKIRKQLYDVMSGAFSGSASDHALALEDPLLMPNGQAMTLLATELGVTAMRSLGEFIGALLLRMPGLILEEIKEQIAQFVAVVEGWMDDLEQAVVSLKSMLVSLLKDIARLAREIEQFLNAALDEAQRLLGLFASPSFRTALKTSIADTMYGLAETVLFDNVLYQYGVPDPAKPLAEQAMRDAIVFLIDNPIVNIAWNALGQLAFGLNELITEVRNFNPYLGIGAQLRDLIIRQAEGALRGAFGPDPKIDLRFGVSWDLPLFGRGQVEFNLGEFRLPVNDLIVLLRVILPPLVALDAIVQPLSAALADFLKTEVQLAQATQKEATLTAESTRAEALLAESIGAHISLTIVEPAPAAMYEANVPLRIDIAGAPLSFMGRNPGEQQRVLIWINQKALNLNGIKAEIVQPPVLAPARPPTAEPVSTSPGGAPAANGGTLVNRVTGTANSGVTLTPTEPVSVQPAVQPPAFRPVTLQPVAVQPAGTGVVTRPAVRTGLAATRADTLIAATPLPSASTLDRSAFVTGLRGNGGGMISPSALGIMSIGARPTVADLAQFTPPAGPVLRLTGTLPLSGFVEGINTIVVVIADGAGLRIEQGASFIVSSPQTRYPGLTGDIRLPDLILNADLEIMEIPPPPRPPEKFDHQALFIPQSIRVAAIDESVKLIEELRAPVRMG